MMKENYEADIKDLERKLEGAKIGGGAESVSEDG